MTGLGTRLPHSYTQSAAISFANLPFLVPVHASLDSRGLPPLLQSEVGVGSGHGLYHVCGGEEAHSTEEDKEDGGQHEAGLGEGPWKGERSHANDEIEDVDKPKL